MQNYPLQRMIKDKKKSFTGKGREWIWKLALHTICNVHILEIAFTDISLMVRFFFFQSTGELTEWSETHKRFKVKTTFGGPKGLLFQA